MRLGLGIGIGMFRSGPRAPVLATQPPSLFWPVNTAQSYNLAQHVTGVTPITYATADTLPTGVTLSSAGTISGTPTQVIAGYIIVTATAANGTVLSFPVSLAIQDVPGAFTVGMWDGIPVENGVRVDISSYPADNSSAISAVQYRKNGGTATALPANRIIADTVAFDIEIRAVNGIGPGGWSDLKNRTPIVHVSDFPLWRESGTPTTATSVTSTFTVTAHASRVAGDLLMILLGLDANPTVSTPTGWTKERDIQAAGGNTRHKLCLFTRVADATATDSPTFTLGTSVRVGCKSWCSNGPMNYVISATTENPNATGWTVDPPNCDFGAAWDADTIAMVVHNGTGTAISAGAAPSGYAFDGNIAATGTSSASVRVHAAQRNIYATSENPGTFGQIVDDPICITVGVKKSAPAVVAPTVATPIADQTVTQNTGGGALTVSSSFAGTAPFTYSISGGPTGTSVDAGGVVTYPTTTAGTWTITVTALNSAGSIGDPFVLTVNAAALPNAVFTLASSVSETFGPETATFNFVDAGGSPEQRYVGQDAAGRWCVVGDAGNPVRVIMARAFASEAGIVSYHQGASSSGTRSRNGAMINPTIIQDRIDFIDAGAPRTAAQGFDNYMYSADVGTVFDAAQNVNTGAAVVMASGVLVQSVGLAFTNATDITQTGGATGFRTKHIGNASITVIPAVPVQNFFAPAPAGSDKTLTSGIHAGMINFGLLGSYTQSAMPGYRTLKALATMTQKMKSSWAEDRDRSRSMKAMDQRPAAYNVGSAEYEYTRDEAKVWGEALVAVHRTPVSGTDDSQTYRDQLVYNLCRIGIDYAAQLQLGADYNAGGGFQTGIKAVVAFAAAMLNLQWMKDLCDPARPRPYAGGLQYRDPGDTSKGQVGYGFAEHKRYVVASAALEELTSNYYPVAGRPYPIPLQPGHRGLPFWFEKGIKPSGEGWRVNPRWDVAYLENCGSDLAGIIGCHMVSGMSSIFRQDYILQYFDRAVPAKRAGKMRSEAGYTPFALAAYDNYRASTGVAALNAQPDQPDPPIITQFVGEGTRLGIRLKNAVNANGSAITSYKIRYRTTTPDRYLTNEAGWTTVTGVSLSTATDYFLTGLTAATGYWVQICAVNANGDSAWSTNLRDKTSAKTAAEGYLVPRATGTTSTNQTVANTTAPFIVGGLSVGQEATIDHGVWSIQPTSYTYQWKRGGSNISGATSRAYTIQSADIGQAITCTVTGANSSSSLPVTTAARTGLAASTVSASLIGATTRFDTTTSTANNTRTVTVTGLTHPKTAVVLFGFVPGKSDADPVSSLNAIVKDGSGNNYSLTTGTNEITAATAEAVSGNFKTGARLLVVPTTSNGGDRISINTNLNLYDTRYAASALAAYDLSGYDVANARYGGWKELTDPGDEELYDTQYIAAATIGIAADGTGAEQIVPKGSLILAVLAAGLHLEPITPIWSSGMTSVDAASGFGDKIYTTGKYGTLAVAAGVQAAAGACTVTCNIGGNPERVAMSLIAIPPA